MQSGLRQRERFFACFFMKKKSASGEQTDRRKGRKERYGGSGRRGEVTSSRKTLHFINGLNWQELNCDIQYFKTDLLFIGLSERHLETARHQKHKLNGNCQKLKQVDHCFFSLIYLSKKKLSVGKVNTYIFEKDIIFKYQFIIFEV